MTWLKIAVGVLALGLIFAAGWQVNTWRTDAGRAKALSEELRAKEELYAKADRWAEDLWRELNEERRLRAERKDKALAELTKRLPLDPRCDLPDDFAGVLNKARGVPQAEP